jgi:lipoprotein-anchoring transpeptidase ErfK/SrfK
LGVHSDAAAVVDKARADARELGMVSRVWHRLFDKPVDRSYPVSYRLDPARVEGLVFQLAKKVERAPVDAKMDTSTGFVTFTSAVPGQALDQATARERLLAMGEDLANGRSAETITEASLKPVTPKVGNFPDVLLIRIGENKLYHYENHSLVRTYRVATGLPEFPTPTGRFEITLKRRNPVWINPDPGGWGKSLPPRIEPGPGNPLGTRALNLSAPGIRIHGTSNVASLGRPASHGCIRMSIPDVEHLFERVEANTPVVIIQGPTPPKPPPPPPPAAVPTFGPANAPIDLAGGG